MIQNSRDLSERFLSTINDVHNLRCTLLATIYRYITHYYRHVKMANVDNE